MSPRLRTLLLQVGSFALAGGLLYFALRGIDLGAVLEALKTADYRWLVPTLGLLLVSHLLRAMRWQVLLEALPASPGKAAAPVTVKTAFYSVMIGYMVNNVAPRLGEVARSANVSARTRLAFSGVFGTVVVERILDMIVLLLALASVFAIFFDRLGELDRLFLEPAAEQLGRLPGLLLLGLAIGLGVLLFSIYRSAVRGGDGLLQRLWADRVRPALQAFREGLLTLLRSKRRGFIAASTVLIWVCYALMTYLPFVMLHMTVPYSLSVLDAWCVMVFGALGIVVPSPAGTGSYHFIAIQTLVHLYGVDPAAAASYAVISHAAQVILYTVVGFLCLLLQGSSLRSLRATTQAAAEPSAEAAPDAPSDAEPAPTRP